MAKQTKILGENTRPTNYNPNLAAQMAKQTEIEEQKEKIEARKREELKQKEQPQTEIKPTFNSNARKREGYIYVPSLGLYISEKRYHTGLKFEEAQSLVHCEGRRMPTIPEFIEFLKYLRSPEGKANVKNVDKSLNEIEKNYNTWRGEWLDATFFTRKKENMPLEYDTYVNYYAFDILGNISLRQEKLENFLKKYEGSQIDLDYWLENHTKQGLPKPDCKSGDLSYFLPSGPYTLFTTTHTNESILYCNVRAEMTDPRIGVRYVEPAIKI